MALFRVESFVESDVPQEQKNATEPYFRGQ